MDEKPDPNNPEAHPSKSKELLREQLEEMGYKNVKKFVMPADRCKLGLAYHDPKKTQYRLRTYSHFRDERRNTNCRQYICHSIRYNYLIMFPGDNYKGVLMYDLRSQVYIGRPHQTPPTSAAKVSTSGSCD